MGNILYNDICVRFLRVPFVVLVFTAFVFVSGAWAGCSKVYIMQPEYGSSSAVCNNSGYQCSVQPTSDRCGGEHSAGFELIGYDNCQYNDGFYAQCRWNQICCNTQSEADSILCVNKGDPWVWNSANGTCDSLSAADTTYKCVNTTMASGTYGERPIAHVYRCVTTGSSSDVCERTSTLNGTCQDWGFCPENEPNCDIDKDSTGDTPCTRSGGGTTSTGRCYYVCPDGSSVSCKPTGTEYVAGAIWVGVCPERPPEGCLPPRPTGESSSSEVLPLSSSSEVFDTIPPDTIDPGTNIDYSRILQAIHDTLHIANKQREILKDWDVDFMRPVKGSIENIESYSLNSWQKEYEINNNLTGFQERGFNLAADVKSDIDSSRLLLDEIKQFLKNDSLKTYSTDTTYNPLLRDIAGKLDSTGSVDSTYDLLRPFFKDTGQYKSPITRFLESFSSNFERSNEDTDFCSSYYSCLSGGGRDCVSRFPGALDKCVNGGSPIDGVINVEMGILETIWDAIFGSDSTPIPRDDDSDSVDVLSPGFSSASAELQRANDSLGAFNLGITLDSMRSMLDSAKRMNNDTTKIQPDSLWLDSSEARRYVEHILLPSGTGTDCFICHADLGNFGGLTDTTLKIHIDFADFGGYNWCEIIRAVVRIATLVVCISLTLGSWAAAFGYNPKNDA